MIKETWLHTVADVLKNLRPGDDEDSIFQREAAEAAIRELLGHPLQDKPPALRQKAIEFAEQWFNRRFVTPEPHQYTDLMNKMVERLVANFSQGASSK